MKKRPMVIKDKKIRIDAKKSFFRMYGDDETYIAAYRHISALFIDRHVETDIKSLMRMVEYFDIYLIDSDGYIQAVVRKE
jgi:hypothetical protein